MQLCTLEADCPTQNPEGYNTGCLIMYAMLEHSSFKRSNSTPQVLNVLLIKKKQKGRRSRKEGEAEKQQKKKKKQEK